MPGSLPIPVSQKSNTGAALTRLAGDTISISLLKAFDSVVINSTRTDSTLKLSIFTVYTISCVASFFDSYLTTGGECSPEYETLVNNAIDNAVNKNAFEAPFILDD